jgi:hypothetical protein
MKPLDHSECTAEDCHHKRDMVRTAADAKEQAYYETKRRVKLDSPEARGMNPTTFGSGASSYMVAGADNYSPGADVPEPRYLTVTVNGMHQDPRTGQEKRRSLMHQLDTMMLNLRMDMISEGDPMPLQELRNVVGDALRLAEHKNRQYGDAWRKQGYMGNLARIQSKAARLNALLWRDAEGDGYPLPANRLGTEQAETVIDTLLDLINLAGFMAVNWSEENRWG